MRGKQLLKGLVAVVLSVFLAVCVAAPDMAEAKTEYMSGKVRLIKGGDTVKVKGYVGGIGYKSYSVRLVEARTSSTRTMKMKQNNKIVTRKFNKVVATFDITYPEFSSAEVKKINEFRSENYNGKWLGFNAFAVNYETGKYVKWYKFEDQDKDWFTTEKLVKNGQTVGMRVNVKFWKLAEDTVVVGVSGGTQASLSGSASDTKYRQGSKTFTSTTYYQKGNKKLSAFVKLK